MTRQQPQRPVDPARVTDTKAAATARANLSGTCPALDNPTTSTAARSPARPPTLGTTKHGHQAGRARRHRAIGAAAHAWAARALVAAGEAPPEHTDPPLYGLTMTRQLPQRPVKPAVPRVNTPKASRTAADRRVAPCRTGASTARMGMQNAGKQMLMLLKTGRIGTNATQAAHAAPDRTWATRPARSRQVTLCTAGRPPTDRRPRTEPATASPLHPHRPWHAPNQSEACGPQGQH